MMIVVSGCMSLEEEMYGKLFPESLYSNRDELELTNNALYSRFSKIFHSDYTTLRIALFGGDDLTTPYSGNVPRMQYDTYVRQAADKDLKDGWEQAYMTINVANGIINNYKKAADALGEAELNRYAAQAYFARATVYFWLVRLFNEIPYVTTAREPDKTIFLSSPETVYESIIEDLKFAETWLPNSWAGIDAVKLNGAAFTAGAAKATLASVYLTMAGYPLNKTENYRLAKEKAAELIDNESSYGYRLIDHCEDLWKPEPKINNEMVLGLIYDGISEYNVFAGKACRPIQFDGWEAYCSEVNFFLRFPAGERREATFVYEFPVTNGGPTGVAIVPVPPDRNDWVKWTDMVFAHPYYQKYWEIEGATGNDKWRMTTSDEWRSGRTMPIIRYAEVLLTYAEAQAMADGTPNDLAYRCVNRVRNRAFAGVGSSGNELQPGLNATAFRDSVFVERGWELAGEFNSRWFDLIRFELVEDAAKETPDNKFLPGRSPSEFTIPSPPTKKSYYLPIPEEDALLNPNLLR